MRDGDSRSPSGFKYPLQAHGGAYLFQDGRKAGRSSLIAARYIDHDDFGIPIEDPTTVGDVSGFFVWKNDPGGATNSGIRPIPTWREVFPVNATAPTTTPGPGKGPIGGIGEDSRNAFGPTFGGSAKPSAPKPQFVYIEIQSTLASAPPPPPPAPSGYVFTGNVVTTSIPISLPIFGSRSIFNFKYEYALIPPTSGGGGGGGGGPDEGTGDPDFPGSAGTGPEFECRPDVGVLYSPDFSVSSLALPLSSRIPFWPRFPIGHYGVIVQTMDVDQQIEEFHPTDPRLPAVNVSDNTACGALVSDLFPDGRYDTSRMAHLQSAFRIIKKPVQTLGHNIGGTGGGSGANGSGNAIALQLSVSQQGDSPGGYVFDTWAQAGGKWNFRDGGFVHVGLTLGDKHKIATDADGNDYNGLHVTTKANYFLNAAKDGPLLFEDNRWIDPADDILYRRLVHLDFDPNVGYDFLGKQLKGVWRWWTTMPITVTTPSYPPPSAPPPPPSIPPPIPPSIPPRLPVDPIGTFPSFPTPGDNFRTVVSGLSANVTEYRRHAVTVTELAAPGLLARPQRYADYEPDLRYVGGWRDEAVEKAERESPVTGRLSAYGAQGGTVGGPYLSTAGKNDWARTQLLGRSRERGGTAPGGFVFLPPEVDLSDVDSDFAPSGLPLSASYFVFAPGTSAGFGVPDLATGGLRDGWSLASNGDEVSFKFHDNVAATIEKARLHDEAFELLDGMKISLEGATSGKVTFQADPTTTDYGLVLPAEQGSGSLTNDGAGNLTWVPAGGGGTVTSVDVALPVSMFSASSGAVTTSGTITFTFINQDANKVFAGPTGGGAATPSWRALVAADIPDISATYLTVSAASAGYQPLDADLTAIAALATAAYGRSLLELADAAALRTAAGLGTFATQSGSPASSVASMGTFGTSGVVGTSADYARADHAHEQVRLGSSAGQACEGNDSRLSDARTPTGSAGGDLTGTYPNPTVAAGKITLAKMADLAQDTFIVRTTASTGVPETATCTAFARTILDDADAATVRTTIGAGTGNGSVTSVDAALPVSTFSASSGAVTGTGTITFTFIAQAANKVFAGPTSGGDATPTWRVLVAADLPDISATYLTVSAAAAAYQPLDADLTAIAALTTTSFGLALLELANAASLRTAAGLGTIATQNANGVAITGGSITGMSSPSGASDVATKGYVDGLIAGLKWKASVVAATTAAGTLATDFEDGDTLDGVTLATGDRILVKDQADQTENGIYVVAASGAPARASDADAGSELVSAAVFVSQGTSNADRAFVCTNDAITLGATNITFTSFASVVGALIAANNLSDLTSASTARSNLGLGTFATQSGSPASSVASMATFGTSGVVGTSTDYARADHAHEQVRLGNSAGQACEGNDSRLSDARTPNGTGWTMGDGENIVLDTTTGTKIGTGSTQKLGFFGVSPVVQQLAVPDATGGATVDDEARAAINDLLARLRNLGLIAT